MSHLSYWPESEGLLGAVSKVNIPPQSELPHEDWTAHYRDEFPDWDVECDPVISNPNCWDYGMRWDDDELRFGSRERMCALQLFLKMWLWQYILMTTLGWRRLWNCLIEKFGALLTICQEIGVIFHPTSLKFLGDVMSVKLGMQGVASKPTHVNLLLSSNIPSHPLQLTSVDCPSVCSSRMEKKMDYLMIIVCRQNGYVLAIPCQGRGSDSKNAASLFLDRCFHMFRLPKEFICDNASIINSGVLKDLFTMSGVEQHSSVAYRPQRIGRAEGAVKSIVSSVRQYAEQHGGSSKHS